MTTMRSEGHATVGRAYSGRDALPPRRFLLAALLCLSFATVLAGGAAAQEVSFSSGAYRVAGPGAPGRHTLSIVDDDPTATFASASGTVREGKLATVEVRLDKPPPSYRTIAYTVGGTATPGADFTLHGDEAHIDGSGTITVGKGGTRITIFVTTVDDSLQEGNETVVLTLAAGEGYAVGGSLGTHTLTIADDDEPRVSFASASGSVGEASGWRSAAASSGPLRAWASSSTCRAARCWRTATTT